MNESGDCAGIVFGGFSRMTRPVAVAGLNVCPVKTSAEIQIACDIMIEAAKWLASDGRSLWPIDQLTPAKILHRPDITLYLAHEGGSAVGTFLLQLEDPYLWPDAPAGEALYLHKLAVRRHVAGRGVSRAMLDFAAQETRFAGRSLLRLDCAQRPKLRAVYESADFRHHSDRNMGTFSVCRYERRV